MGIRRKMFLPIAAAFLVLGGVSLVVMYFRLDGLERDFVSQIVQNKTREVDNAIDTASRMTLGAGNFASTDSEVKTPSLNRCSTGLPCASYSRMNRNSSIFSRLPASDMGAMPPSSPRASA